MSQENVEVVRRFVDAFNRHDIGALALRWEDVDLATGVIRVERGWDAEQGAIEAKSRAARRGVPITAVLRDHLVEQRMVRGERPARGLVFGVTDAHPFEPSTVRRRALAAWKRAKLRPIALHEARHTFASLGIAAGLNAKALSAYMGHASVTITYDRYGHLMPANEAEAAGLLDAYLLRSAEGQSRGSGPPAVADVGGSERDGSSKEIPALTAETAD
jgi:integrase